LLHQSQPPDEMKTSSLNNTTQHVGASPHLPLNASPSCTGTSKPTTQLHAPNSFEELSLGWQEEVPTTPPPQTNPQNLIKPLNHHRALKSSCYFPHAQSHRHRAKRSKMSTAPSSNVVPHRVSSAMLNNPSRSAAGQVVTSCRCRKRRTSTLFRTTLAIAERHQALRYAASN
jgi:hypothetical protein